MVETLASFKQSLRQLLMYLSLSLSIKMSRKELTLTGKNLLRAFELSSNVVYHKGSIVFDIDGTAAQLWIECLKKKVGEPIELADGSGFRMTKDDLQIPLVSTKSTDTNFGSVTVTVYPNPKTSNPKIMIQGKMYMAFVAFIMPMVIKDMKKVSQQ